MRKLVSLVVLLASAFTLEYGHCQEKKTETILITTTASEIAQEFAKNPAEAAKKYNPNPPKKGAAGGAIIKISGELEKTVGADIYLRVDPPTKPAIKVAIRLKKADPAAKGKKAVTVDGGIFKEFKNQTIVIEADGVSLREIIGDEEKKDVKKP